MVCILATAPDGRLLFFQMFNSSMEGELVPTAVVAERLVLMACEVGFQKLGNHPDLAKRLARKALDLMRGNHMQIQGDEWPDLDQAIQDFGIQMDMLEAKLNS